MRTTVELDAEADAAVKALRRQGLGASEAVNELIRRGLVPRDSAPPFRQVTKAAGIKVDVSNVAEVLDLLEGSDAR
ncbi:MAG: CopG family transcriptional regulator [Iamia sp.]